MPPAATGLPPPRSPINVPLLVAALDDKTQCYKILMSRALIDVVAEGGDAFVPYAGLAARMAEMAFWPTRLYLLRIGIGDRLSAALEILGDLDVKSDPLRLRATLEDRLPDQTGDGFLRYVPQRLLRPWYGDRLKRVRDVDAHIRATSGRLRDVLGMPYGQVARGRASGIELAPAWRSYFQDNLAVVRGWLDQLWIEWLQARNPGVAVPLAKTRPADVRRPLTRQRDVFAFAIESPKAFPAGARCIYTRRPIVRARDLDHFAPWSFVGHDAIWNLIPVEGAINSSKGARFPAERYIPALARFHSRIIGHLDSRGRRGRDVREEYALGLRLGMAALDEPRSVAAAYGRLMGPMYAVARSMGFTVGWVPGRGKRVALPDAGRED